MNTQAAEVIGVGPGGRRDRRIRRRASRPGRIAAVGLGLYALLPAGGALAQCARCGQTNVVAPVSAPVAPAPRRTVFARLWSGTTTWSEDRRSHQVPTRPASGGGSSIAVCVRACDGSFFPVSYANPASRAESLQQVCRSLCPNTEVVPYSFPFGGTIDEAVSTTGEAYGRLPNAHKFEESFDPDCSCLAQGESWAQALAAAEARYRRPSQDTLVTAADAERMSRPAGAPKATPAAGAEPSAAAEVDPDLDVSGVDTVLTARVKTISHETSGVRDQDPQRPVSYGLKQGHTIEQTEADGSLRKVRVLPTTF